MSLFDNIESQAQSWLTNFGPKVIESGLQSVGLIKVSNPPTSNLTAAQVQSGQSGYIQQLGNPPSGMPSWLLPVGALVGVIAIFFAVKK